MDDLAWMAWTWPTGASSSSSSSSLLAIMTLLAAYAPGGRARRHPRHPDDARRPAVHLAARQRLHPSRLARASSAPTTCWWALGSVASSTPSAVFRWSLLRAVRTVWPASQAEPGTGRHAMSHKRRKTSRCMTVKVCRSTTASAIAMALVRGRSPSPAYADEARRRSGSTTSSSLRRCPRTSR